jgi:uracil-DNA glycosylase family 4
MMSLLDMIEGTHQRLLRPSGGCHNCPRRRVDFVAATLRAGSVLWLGEAPGADEVEEGEGFVGRAGKLLRRVAAEEQVPEPWSFSNAVHCRPPNNITPTPKEVTCCLSQFVLDEIRDYPFVVLCGAVPLNALFPGVKASHFRGNVAHHPDFPGQHFYAIYHPAYILRRQDMEGEFRAQLNRLQRLVRGEAAADWRVLQGGGAEFQEALEAALAAPLIAPDLETTALESWDPLTRIRSLALTADGKTALFVHEDEPHWVATLEKVRTYLEKPEKAVVGNNIGFDLDMLEHALDFEVRCTGVHDLGVIWNQAKQYKQPSLKELVARELDGYRYLIHNPAKEANLTLLAQYNAEDVIYGYRLFQKGMQALKPKTRDLVTRAVSPMSLELRRIQSTGFYLRQDYREEQVHKYREQRKAVVAAWHEEDPEFIPKKHESGNGLQKYLFEIRKLPIIAETEKGSPSTDQAAIKQWIRNGATYLGHLLSLREIDKRLSTYLEAYDKFLGPDGRLRSSYTLTYTDTGRPSSRDPNLLNIPRQADIRNLFGVPPGALLVEADLNQMEFRIMVCLSQDETGIQGYLKGKDAHTLTATTMAGGTPTKEQRSQAKPVNFALCYGGSWKVVQATALNDYGLDWTEDECRQFTKDFFETYKRFPAFHEAASQRLIQNRGWFESVLGHNFYYRDWNHQDQGRRDHAFRAALNSEAQGPCAQICYAIMIQTRRLLQARGLSRDARFVNTVYDSIIMELRKPKLLPALVETMQEAVALTAMWVRPWFVVPLVMDYKVGESWGSLEDYDVH